MVVGRVISPVVDSFSVGLTWCVGLPVSDVLTVNSVLGAVVLFSSDRNLVVGVGRGRLVVD